MGINRMHALSKHHSWLLLAAAGTVAAGPSAQPILADEYEEDDVQIRTKVLVMGDEGAVAISGNHSVAVIVDNDDISIKIDGVEVPSHRIRKTDGRIVIIDEDGDEIRSFNLFAGHGRDDLGFSFDFDEGNWPKSLESYWTTLPGPEPNVMLGIHMTEPSKALLYHLRLHPGEVAMISGLYEGLPAHNAGLDQYDIIVAVDGSQPAGQQAIREALADKEPGDEVTLTILKKGRTREIVVTLEAFDRSQMEQANLIGGGNRFITEIVIPDKGIFMPRGGNWRELLGDANTRQHFERWFENSELSNQFEHHLSEALREHWPSDLDDRLEGLNLRMDDLKEIIDALIEHAQEIAED